MLDLRMRARSQCKMRSDLRRLAGSRYGGQVRPISSSVGRSSCWVVSGAVSLLLHVLPRIFPRQAGLG